jgi:hypothetical protein
LPPKSACKLQQKQPADPGLFSGLADRGKGEPLVHLLGVGGLDNLDQPGFDFIRQATPGRHDVGKIRFQIAGCGKTVGRWVQFRL